MLIFSFLVNTSPWHIKYTKYSTKYLKKKVNIRLHYLKTYQRTEDWLEKTDKIKSSDKCNKKTASFSAQVIPSPTNKSEILSSVDDV